MAKQPCSYLLTFMVFMVVFPAGEAGPASSAGEQCSVIARELKLPAKLRLAANPIGPAGRRWMR